ncbi:hypothetical protein COT20_01780 [bacterium (Candidatus Gribaldobacteria) CG08_land_8_20_14_0_20_39_15]|uniref:Glycosyltransferase 2-like domain-containing protein n=1 Tax=bacterium (Candidatus Gribaldobacteria) CG08_land_8_20_14_0_20_39_15 TaxID=2014273 RepID=A0A2M6XUC6_9BACT|nr:MAG: hypothetical protein COT20_01780 [bacterium (Candidatus Gribaldobacteria) CG08_land_8_20_14_0_20_39_15]
MDGEKNKIVVVIISYNGWQYLPDCFRSLEEQTLLPEEIIIVDNNSNDGTKELLADLASLTLKVKIIFNKKNLGFAQANNQGITEALKINPDYIFLLNQDTVCHRECLEQLAKSDSREQVFAKQALILCWPPENGLIQTAGDKIHFLGFGHSGDYRLQITGYRLQVKEITYASGAAMFINAQALEEVGLFDKDSFMYHDDMEICLRARFLGYKIILAPQALVYHKYTEKISRLRWYWSERNRLLTLIKFYKLPTLILLFIPLILMELGVLGYSLVTGWFLLKIKSYFSILWQLPKTLWKRRKIQMFRQISDYELAQILEGEFHFAGLEHPLIKYIVNPVFGFFWRICKNLIFW